MNATSLAISHCHEPALFLPLSSSGLPWIQKLPGAPFARISDLGEAERVIQVQEERIRQLENLALTDELTGLANRRGLLLALRRELAAARRSRRAQGVVVLIDLDGFKQINDTWGHAAGDAYLQTVAGVLQNEVRSSDFVARLGGDEFAVLFPRLSTKAGMVRVERLQQAFNKRAMPWLNTSLPLRASFGFSFYVEGDTSESVLVAADRALYAHKSRHAIRSAS